LEASGLLAIGGLCAAEDKRVRVLHEFEPGERPSREHTRMRLGGESARAAWKIVALALVCGLAVGLVAMLVAVFVLHLG
jgi:hypothetical protein